ncbi:MAG: hypothetical protein V4792_16400 [Pseudomonadota bacterium]
MTALLLFAATFGAVFALGLQSLNVNGGHKLLAALTSLLIGISHLVLFKVLPGPTDALQIAGYLLGGPLGILASMWAHPQLVAWLAARRGGERRATSRAPMHTARVDVGPYPARPESTADAPSPLNALAWALLNRDDLALSVSPEVRDRAREALGMTTRERT